MARTAFRSGSTSVSPRGALLAVVLALAAGAIAPASAGAVGSGAVSELLQAPCPEYEQTHAGEHSDEDVERAVEDGHFTLIGRPVTLRPPVNWAMDPYGSRTWRLRALHGWKWSDVLFYGYRQDAWREALRDARDLGLDWLRQNPQGTREAWADKISGDRAGYLGYLTRAAACEDMLTREKARRLLEAVEDHGNFLMQDENYSSTNHGLFMDLGLLLLSRYVPFLDESDDWRDRAVNRFKHSLERNVNVEEGVHLEHSPAYHFIIRDLVELGADWTDGEEPWLERLLSRMNEVAAWFVLPNDRLVQFGDTNLTSAPGFAAAAGRFQRGVSPTRRSGYAIVKEPGSYLGIAAGFHSQAHKQADELTFDLFEDGQHVLADTGRVGFDRRDESSFAFGFDDSSQAHSTLTVDNESFKLRKGSEYGSGIRATGAGDGWYAVQGRNPTFKSGELDHRRVFLYRPGSTLVVVDDVDSDERHTYRRYFQFDPGIDVDGDGGFLGLAGGGFSGTLLDMPTGASQSRKVVKGQRNPMLGWYEPGKWADLVPRYTAVFKSESRDVEHAVAFGLQGGSRVEPEVLESGDGATTVRLTTGTGPPLTVRVTRDDHRLEVNEVGPAP